MECCLYCGEPIALLQRWKLGRAKGLFCSKEHEEAHTRLQAQAVLRLMLPRGADEVTITADEESPELAPPVMSAKPRDSVSRFSPVFDPKPVTRQPAHPPRKPFGPCFAIADYVAVPMSAGLPEALVPMLAGEYETPGAPLPEVAALNRACSVGLELAAAVSVDLHPCRAHRIEVRFVLAEFDIPMMLPRFSQRILARVLTAGAISLRGDLRARSAPTLICGQAGERWAEREISLQFPQMGAPTAALDRAGLVGGFTIMRNSRVRTEIRSCEPVEWGFDSSPLALPVELAASVEGEIPEFLISPLVGPPIEPRPEDCTIHVPAELLALRRGAYEMGREQSALPSFKAIPLEILTVPAEPIFSLAPLRFTRAKAQAAVC